MENLLIAIVFAFAVAFVLIYFISAHDRKYLKSSQEQLKNSPSGGGVPIEFRQFSKICMDLCENVKLDVKEVTQPADNEVQIKAYSQNPIAPVEHLILGIHIAKGETLDNTKIMQISDQMISERISKGLIITTGEIDGDMLRYPELAPIDFVDGKKLATLVEEYKINF